MGVMPKTKKGCQKILKAVASENQEHLSLEHNCIFKKVFFIATPTVYFLDASYTQLSGILNFHCDKNRIGDENVGVNQE